MNCSEENNVCVQSCGPFGDPACAAQCNVNENYCGTVCREDYDLNVTNYCR